MRVYRKKILGFVLTMAVLLAASHGLAQEKFQGDQTSGEKGKSVAVAPDLADIIPMASELSVRLADN